MSESSPKILWHYTTIETAAKILLGRTLWATHAAFLNDSSEYLHGLNIISILLNELSKSGEFDRAKYKILFDSIGIDAEQEIDIDDKQKYEKILQYLGYIVSFSEKKDLLSLWRAYTPNGGCAIGFDKEELDKLCSEDGCSLQKCLYIDEPSSLKPKIMEIIEKIKNSESKKSNSNTQTTRKEAEQILSQWQDEISSLEARIKHPAFKEENEWRIVISSSEKLQVQFDTLKPHIVLGLNSHFKFHSLIKEIIISPHGSFEQSKLFLTLLRDRLKIELKIEDFFDIGKSQIPYRNL